MDKKYVDSTDEIICAICGSPLFETNPLLSAMEGKIIWSHLEDTKCDDPTPEVSLPGAIS